jgi:hypothetical protein
MRDVFLEIRNNRVCRHVAKWIALEGSKPFGINLRRARRLMVVMEASVYIADHLADLAAKG